MNSFDGIIFDMDGTLVDSEVIWEEAEMALFADLGITYSDEVRQQVIGLRLDEFFAKLIEIYDLAQSTEELGADLTRRMLVLLPQKLEAKPGAREIIDYAKEQDVPYCIASSSSVAIIEAVIATMGWEDDFPRYYSANAVPNGKPAPDIYLYAAEQLGLAPERCLALEDSPNGSRAAVAANMTCYAIPDGHSSHDRFAEITPHVFDSLHDVLTHLRAQET